MNASQTAIHPVEELERRVQALDEVLDSEVSDRIVVAQRS
jgi:hypothetical protein